MRRGSLPGEWGNRRTVPNKELIFEKSIPEPNSGCWLWLGSFFKAKRRVTDGKQKPPYGRTWVGGKTVQAHRISYSIFYGKNPEGLVVRHACDNSACVNPDHLILGTQAENVADMISRGMQYSGPKPWARGNFRNLVGGV